jgi:nitrite reductase (cytochrome c-552)
MKTNDPKRRFSPTVVRQSLLTLLATAVATFALTALLVSIFRHKTEAENPYLRFVEVTQATTDPEPWGLNWPRELDEYRKTVQPSKTNFGGGDASPAEKAAGFPFLTRMFAGYAFSLDYRDRRGHAFMLLDQEKSRRVTERPQPGSCLHCHASLIPTLVRLGGGDPAAPSWSAAQIDAGFRKLSAMPYEAARAEVIRTGSRDPIPGKPDEFHPVPGAHPVSCTDCHNARTMRLEVRRPGFVAGIRALKSSQGVRDFQVNRDATRAEMRTYVCAQCHVEYYCGPKTTLFFPWNNGLKVEQIESYYDAYRFPDGHRFYDWAHAETGAELLKAQHPEFETWSQGVHARSGVACADCHMPYSRQGAIKVSDHHVRSPLLMVNRSCQQCHSWEEAELRTRVTLIQERNLGLLRRAGQALLDFLDEYRPLRAAFERARPGRKDLDLRWAEQVAGDPELRAISELHRQAQWRLDFVAAENSMGFHAPQEAARILGESIDGFRQAQLKARALRQVGR